MERIFAGEVYEMIAQPNGIIFSYCKSQLGKQALVGYKMISFDSRTLTDVAKNIYQLSKFGSNYRAVATLCTNYISARAITLPSGGVFAVEQNGHATLFDNEGMPAWTGELIYKGNSLSDVALYRNSLWACYSESNVLLRFNLSTMREELRIGGKASPFNKPNNIFIDGNEAVISNVGSNKLVRVNLENFNLQDYMEFNEPIYGYVKVKNYEFVLMKSGIYII